MVRGGGLRREKGMVADIRAGLAARVGTEERTLGGMGAGVAETMEAKVVEAMRVRVVEGMEAKATEGRPKPVMAVVVLALDPVMATVEGIERKAKADTANRLRVGTGEALDTAKKAGVGMGRRLEDTRLHISGRSMAVVRSAALGTGITGSRRRSEWRS
jgi:hypothetical protein